LCWCFFYNTVSPAAKMCQPGKEYRAAPVPIFGSFGIVEKDHLCNRIPRSGYPIQINIYQNKIQTQ
jgi:hypothetical protein